MQHEYLTLNGKVARETIAVDGTVTTVMDFIYDESGRPFALKYSDNGGKSFDTYYYVLNLQGDVVKLVWYIPGFEYEAVATYTYDAWGNILTATGDLAEINPLRYRGYYYDSETGFYYLQSRYYDPVQHRYLNADTVFDYDVGFPGYNLYAYCGNSPVFRIDVNGRDSEPADDHEELLNNAVVDNAAPSPPTPGFEGGYGGGGSCSGAAPTVEEDEDLRDVNDYIKAKNAIESNTNNTQSGTSQAPKTNTPNTVYTQITSDGTNSVASRTLYNEYGMPGLRIDYVGRAHNAGLPHIHCYRYTEINGIMYPSGDKILKCLP